MTHTPGPWKVEHHRSHLHIATNKGIRLDNEIMDANDPTHEANARLIAAAPELLDAAIQALGQMETVSRYVEEVPGITEGCDYWRAMGALRRAIEKATRE
jgi:hypothetical protein